MIILKDFDDVITSNNEYYEEVKGHQLDNHTVIAFHRYANTNMWMWQMLFWYEEIIEGNVSESRMDFTPIDPSGFIWNNEIYKISEELL